jgi:hypothetical protein
VANESFVLPLNTMKLEKCMAVANKKQKLRPMVNKEINFLVTNKNINLFQWLARSFFSKRKQFRDHLWDK